MELLLSYFFVLCSRQASTDVVLLFSMVLATKTAFNLTFLEVLSHDLDPGNIASSADGWGKVGSGSYLCGESRLLNVRLEINLGVHELALLLGHSNERGGDSDKVKL